MQTNIPFQAPGSNAAPRGQAQEGGTTAAAVVKNAAKQIKQNAKEGPSNKPFGIGRGPLVRGAQKMNQPGSIERVKEAPTEVYKQQSSLKKEKEVSSCQQLSGEVKRLNVSLMVGQWPNLQSPAVLSAPQHCVLYSCCQRLALPQACSCRKYFGDFLFDAIMLGKQSSVETVSKVFMRRGAAKCY